MNIITKYITLILTLISGSVPTITTHNSQIPVQTKDEGLYLSTPSRYVYKGKDPNNYLNFNNELWRIISFEPDGTIKIIKTQNLQNIPFDEANSNNWETSSLNSYLNNTYLNSIPKEYQNLIETHSWNIGSVYKTQKSGETLKSTKEEEREITYKAKIGLVSMSEYVEAMHDTKLCGSISLIFKNESRCQNYLDKTVKEENKEAAWTISKDEYSESTVYYIGNTYFPDNMANSNFIAAMPALYLNKHITLTGDGTKQNPYQITKTDWQFWQPNSD